MSEELKTIIKTLKLRRRNLRRRKKEEHTKQRRLDHKSRGVRLASPYGRRSNWYLDREQELNLVIDFLEGKVDRSVFVRFLAGDEGDRLITAIGNLRS